MNVEDNNSEIVDLITKIYTNRFLILKSLVFSSILGVSISLFIPNKYTSSTIFIPQITSENNISKSSSSLSGLASLAGINLNGMDNSNSIPPSLYPQIINSNNFKLELLKRKINYGNDEISVRDYLLKKGYGISYFKGKFFGKINDKNTINSNDIYEISEEDNNLFEHLSKNLNISINNKEGFIYLTYTDEDKVVSANITNSAKEILERKIINYKITASKELLDFSLKQFNLKKSSFNKLQEKRANFEDQNLNILSSLRKIELDRLNSEIAVSQRIVEELANQVERAKLQVSKDTPVITVISAVTIPFKKSYPNRTAISLLFIFIGLSIAFIYIFLKKSIIGFYQILRTN